jgi:hypothetical protein
MSKKDDLRIADYLNHMIEAIRRIDRYIDGLNEIDFLNDELAQCEPLTTTSSSRRPSFRQGDYFGISCASCPLSAANNNSLRSLVSAGNCTATSIWQPGCRVYLYAIHCCRSTRIRQ